MTPDQARPAVEAVECTFCRARVLVRPEVPPEERAIVRPPPPMPADVEVQELAPPAPIALGPPADPYRTAAPMPAREPPGMLIRWRTRDALRFNAFYVAVSLAIAAAMMPWPGLGIAALTLPALYSLATRVVNRTTVEIRRGSIRVRTGPLPVRRPVLVETAALGQLYALERADDERKPSARFVVRVRDRRGNDRELVHTETAEQALWLEHRIEQHLGIADAPVVGELTKGDPAAGDETRLWPPR